MRVIKTDELANGVEFVKRHLIVDTDYLRGYVAALMAIVDLSEQHSIDVQEPVVRCKDCKWFGGIGCAIRIEDESDKPKADDFCSFAERRGEDGCRPAGSGRVGVTV